MCPPPPTATPPSPLSHGGPAHPLGSHRCSAAAPRETGWEGRPHRQAASGPLSELQTITSFSNIH
ncbi:mCG147008 [Mus musculus]|nr:mCG147008 [Mus musculus]